MEKVMDKSPIFVEKGAIMDTMELKSGLHDLIEAIEDNKILSAVYLLLSRQQVEKEEKDFWDELPEHVKAGINEALEESERGEGIPHHEVMKQIHAKYQRV